VLGKGWPSDDIEDILSPRMRHQFLKACRNLAKRYGGHELSYQRYTNIPGSNSENSSPLIIARNEYICSSVTSDMRNLFKGIPEILFHRSVPKSGRIRLAITLRLTAEHRKRSKTMALSGGFRVAPTWGLLPCHRNG
jgi:hypothetical protein